MGAASLGGVEGQASRVYADDLSRGRADAEAGEGRDADAFVCSGELPARVSLSRPGREPVRGVGDLPRLQSSYQLQVEVRRAFPCEGAGCQEPGAEGASHQEGRVAEPGRGSWLSGRSRSGLLRHRGAPRSRLSGRSRSGPPRHRVAPQSLPSPRRKRCRLGSRMKTSHPWASRSLRHRGTQTQFTG